MLTGFLPQARVSDQAICTGPPDVIVRGSPTVLVEYLMAARIGDQTAHGGVIVTGCPTVIIGEVGMGGGGIGAALDTAAQAGVPFVDLDSAVGQPGLPRETEPPADTPEPPEPPQKITPAEADAIIERDYGDALPSDKRGAGLGQASTKVLDDDAFRKVYEDAFGDDGEYEITNAFADPAKGEVYIHEERDNGGTALHETLHMYSHDNFRGGLSRAMNEATTEYLTQKETAGRGIDRSEIYPEERAAISELADLVGDDAIEQAYFGGDVDQLKAAVDEQAGDGAWDNFADAVGRGELDAARSALRPPEAPADADE